MTRPGTTEYELTGPPGNVPEPPATPPAEVPPFQDPPPEVPPSQDPPPDVQPPTRA